MHILQLPDDAALLERFYVEVYLPAFAHQREPLETWTSRLAGGPYDLTIAIEVDGDAPIGGIVYERYRASGCGLITYAVVAPVARGRGLGRALIDHACNALRAAGAPLVLGEIHDPARGGDRSRLERFRRWGARVLDVPYVQPDLGAGLGRDRDLLLVAFDPRAEMIDGAPLAAFFQEFFDITEGGEISIATDEDLAALVSSCAGSIKLR